MAVGFSVIGRIAPGRYDDFLHDIGQTVKIFERHGVDTVRLWTAAAAGEQQDCWVLSMEFPSMAAYGATYDTVMSDDEMRVSMMRVHSASPSATATSSSIFQEVPLGRTPKPGHGPVLETHASRIVAGRLEDGLASAARACDFVEAHGATNARVWLLSYAGAGTGLYLASWELPSMTAWGQLADAWANDPTGQEVAASMASANPPSVLVASGLYVEIPV
jgi:hypothetical protein